MENGPVKKVKQNEAKEAKITLIVLYPSGIKGPRFLRRFRFPSKNYSLS